MGLDLASAVLVNKYNKVPFWDSTITSQPYSHIVSNAPDNEAIRSFQLDQLKILSDQATNASKDNFKDLYNYIVGAPKALAEYPQKLNEELSNSVTKIVTAFNSMVHYRQQRDKQKKHEEAAFTEVDYNKMSDILRRLSDTIKVMNDKFALDPEQGVPNQILKSVQDAIKNCENRVGGEGLQGFLNSMYKYQGEYVEAMGEAWLNSLNFPNISTIRFGGVNVKGSDGKKRQAIQDLIVYEADPIKLSNIIIEWEDNEGNKNSSNLEAFFNKIAQANNSSTSITVDASALNTALSSLSQIGIQAKSGKKQKLFNKNNLTAVGLSDMRIDENTKAYIDSLYLLSDLYEEDIPDENFALAETHETYNALFNYCLGTALNKVLSIGQTQNTYVLTVSGFQSYYERMVELFKLKLTNITIAGDYDLRNPTAAYMVTQNRTW